MTHVDIWFSGRKPDMRAGQKPIYSGSSTHDWTLTRANNGKQCWHATSGHNQPSKIEEKNPSRTNPTLYRPQTDLYDNSAWQRRRESSWGGNEMLTKFCLRNSNLGWMENCRKLSLRSPSVSRLNDDYNQSPPRPGRKAAEKTDTSRTQDLRAFRWDRTCPLCHQPCPASWPPK